MTINGYKFTASFILICIVAFAACTTDPERAKQEYLDSGNRFFDQKKYAEAIVQYRNALQHDAKFGAARYKLAQAHERQGDISNALREYIRAADALPDDVEVQVMAATYLLLARQFEDARLRAEKALKKDPGNVKAQIIRGNALAGLKNFDEALKELEDAVKLDPTAGPGFASLGAVQAARGNQVEAEAAFRSAVQIDSKNPIAHMALANYLWSVRRPADAEASFKQALALDPDNLVAHRALATFYTANNRAAEAEPHLKILADTDTSPAASRKLALADYYLALNRPDDAMKLLEEVAEGKDSYASARTRVAAVDYRRKGAAEGNRVIDEVLVRDPKNVPALLTKAQFLFRERKLDEALTRALAAAAADPESLQAHYLSGTIYLRKNQIDEAIKSFNEVLRINPRAVAAQVQLSQLNLAAGARTSALQLAQDAAKALPGDPIVQLNLIANLLASGDIVRAEARLKQLVARYPNVAPVLVAAGKVALRKRDLRAARRAFEAAEGANPADFESFSGQVHIDFAEKRADAAKARVDRRLATNPTDSRTLVLAATVYSRFGDIKRTEELLRSAIEADASNLEPYSMLAQIYRAQKRIPEARAQLEAIISRRPSAIGPPTMIGILYKAEGNVSEAKRRYEQVLRLNPNAAVAANNLAYLYAEDGGNLELALQLAQTAKSKLPDSAAVADTLGWIYVKKDLHTLGLPQLQQAAAMVPDNAMVQYHLGVALSKTGDEVQARKALERALALKLEPNAAAEARKLVTKLQG